MIRLGGPRLAGIIQPRNVAYLRASALLRPRFYSTETPPTPKKKKKVSKQSGDISQVPLNFIGVMADFYIPPRFRDCPPTSWHKLAFRRLGAFVVNTYNIVKYRRETGLKVHFNDWKDNAIELFVKTNKIFASGCNKRVAEREAYLKKQLGEVSCVEVINSLVSRAKTFPTDSKISWELVSLESNPKVVSFNVLPDANEITMYIQFVLKAKTKQKLSIVKNNETHDTERIVTDYLVYTLNPYTDEMFLAGTLFESDHIRKVTPDEKFTNVKYMLAFTKASGDIYRADPRKQIEN